MTTWAMVRAAVLILLVAGLSGNSLAQSNSSANAADMKQQFIKRFNAADTNGDGKLTREEAKAGMPAVYKHFDEIDRDKKGYVTIADIAARAAARRKAKGELDPPS
jgi:Ca2+-binding EF-hand superfamily protein